MDIINVTSLGLTLTPRGYGLNKGGRTMRDNLFVATDATWLTSRADDDEKQL